ncbi:hypothetical protein AAF712_006160 [Marasmius tenuissimus]|uniref:Uncharacterized protein n=1 Tax=Marasmius tenuissimus TaxID=585030 RepID=A0ABR3A058_9AGAR
MTQSASETAEHIGESQYAKRAQELIALNLKIDSLGGNFEFNLPKIAVIGGQSSGKSSLIEAISKITVPRDDGTCTRCPMECTTSTASTWSCDIYLRENYDANGNELSQPRRPDFKSGITNPGELELWIRRAQAAVLCLGHRSPSEFHKMNADETKALLESDEKALHFSKNIVGVDVKGPDATPLTFIDLPGLIYNTKDPAAIKLVKNLIRSSIVGGKDSNTVILVVIPMTGEMEGQEAMRFATEYDSSGVRTVVALTKPDNVGLGDTGAQRRWKKILDGEGSKLKHGYYCVRLPNDEDRKMDSQAFLTKVEDCYNSPPWSDVANRNAFGVQNLVSSLSKLLVDLIESNLPKLRKQVATLLQQHEAELTSLPPLPVDPANIRMRRLFDQFLRAVDSVVKGESHRQTFVQRNRATYASFKVDIWRTGIEFVPSTSTADLPTMRHQDEWKDLLHHDESFDSKSVPEWEKKGHPQFHKKLSLRDVRDVINESIGWELPGHVPFQATITLVDLSISQWTRPTEVCASKVFENSWKVLEELIKEHFRDYDELRELVRKATFDNYKSCYELTRKAVEEALKEEKSPLHTQNVHYYASQKELWKSRLTAACDTMNHSWDWSGELELMASVRAYWKVAFKRFIDVIPRRIEHKLNRDFNDSLTEQLRTEIMDKTSHERVEVLMDENKEIAEKRTKLLDSIKRLKEVEELVGTYTGGVDDLEQEEVYTEGVGVSGSDASVADTRPPTPLGPSEFLMISDEPLDTDDRVASIREASPDYHDTAMFRPQAIASGAPRRVQLGSWGREV